MVIHTVYSFFMILREHWRSNSMLLRHIVKIVLTKTMVCDDETNVFVPSWEDNTLTFDVTLWRQFPICCLPTVFCILYLKIEMILLSFYSLFFYFKTFLKKIIKMLKKFIVNKMDWLNLHFFISSRIMAILTCLKKHGQHFQNILWSFCPIIKEKE